MLERIDLEKIVALAKEAGDAIMQIYEKDFTIEYKDDKSPLTEADTKANKIICDALTKLYPDIPLMSEENKEVPYSERKEWECYWCIDPIDGTKEFIKKNGEFTVNIALIHKNTPVLGVVYAPAIEEMYKAKQGEGAFKNNQKLPLHVNSSPKEKMSVVASKSHLSKETQEFIDALDTKETAQVSKGSSLKLCMVAEGVADIYPRLAPTMEWDTAAADAIVREAGKTTWQFEKKEPMVYNKDNLLNPWFIVK
ncbi:3'(2'),5'-bisphosphate nucleotidase CysQ [Sulfurimonas sediminis]|uniref:3'(2'),5'-bisphosphate nucleotidase CysQ n=1 Tax=Sulfurimonas sediminis TaxID=2590020 RepID=A0A7M1B1V1_9BACT|nr:3'(2'),5'-bisphosphate nucleotidase CysQ [Sulfurimonas sediminis]QOP42642.1 3'(2'),5'-bisphosphate nucleotidase CysQ [Sulfurimonas sediminis]